MSGSEVFPRKLVTIVERKKAEAKRRKLASDAAARELREYGLEHGGRFVVFGSYVTDSMRFDSDFDILVDFPMDGTADAWAFAEEVCARHVVPLDIHDARTTTAAFVERVLRNGLVL